MVEILGHEWAQGLLRRAVAQGRVPPAVLLSGPDGIGKRTLALAVARALVCEKSDGWTCGECGPCIRAMKGLHPDLMAIEAATSVIKIEQIRDLIRQILGRPFEARSRAFVIDDAHLMTEEASNALLKSLEEPPASSHVFLVTASPQALLPTIRSRCQELRLSPLPTAVLEEQLRKKLPPEEARLRAALSAGSLGHALSFESEAYRSLRDELLGLLEGLGRMGPLERMETAERLAEQDDPVLALTTLRSLLRDLVALHAGVRSDAVLNADVAHRLVPLAKALGKRASALTEAVGEVRVALEGNANRLLSMDLLMDTLEE
jgi:DNA polymerase-3 subunit delta'